MRGLSDKVAIVAGAAPGIVGGATAIRLAEEGAKVVAADPNEAAAAAVADQIREFGGTASATSFDITDEGSYKVLNYGAVSEVGALHGRFNVAAGEADHRRGVDRLRVHRAAPRARGNFGWAIPPGRHHRSARARRPAGYARPPPACSSARAPSSTTCAKVVIKLDISSRNELDRVLPSDATTG